MYRKYDLLICNSYYLFKKRKFLRTYRKPYFLCLQTERNFKTTLIQDIFIVYRLFIKNSIYIYKFSIINLIKKITKLKTYSPIKLIYKDSVLHTLYLTLWFILLKNKKFRKKSFKRNLDFHSYFFLTFFYNRKCKY